MKVANTTVPFSSNYTYLIDVFYRADEYSEKAQGIIVEDENIIYPSDVEVDTSGLLWALSNRLPKFQHGRLLEEDVNIRILSGSIRTIIKGTMCDAM